MVAWWLEALSVEHEVVGSNPGWGKKKKKLGCGCDLVSGQLLTNNCKEVVV